MNSFFSATLPIYSSLLLLFIIVLPFPQSALAQTQTVVDPDSVLRMEFPEDWTHVDLGLPEASVQMANAIQDGFLMLIIESKDDFFGWNMTRFIYVTIGQSVTALNLPDVSAIAYGETDGFPSARVVVSGATSGQQFTYLRLAIDGPEHWIQVILGSKRSTYQDNLPIFESAIASIDLLRDESMQ